MLSPVTELGNSPLQATVKWGAHLLGSVRL